MICTLVLGARSSGTRLLTRILVDAGAFGSHASFQPLDALDQGFDALAPEGSGFVAADVVAQLPAYHACVVRRSLPHGAGWPDLAVLSTSLLAHGIRINNVLFACRDAFACTSSMLRARHETQLNACQHSITRAFAHASSFCIAHSLALTPVMYSKLGDAAYRDKLLASLGLATGRTMPDVRDEDRKYYE